MAGPEAQSTIPAVPEANKQPAERPKLLDKDLEIPFSDLEKNSQDRLDKMIDPILQRFQAKDKEKLEPEMLRLKDIYQTKLRKIIDDYKVLINSAQTRSQERPSISLSKGGLRSDKEVLYKEAQDYLKTFLDVTEALLRDLKPGEIIKLREYSDKIEFLARSDKKTREILEKLSQGTALTKQDYEKVIELMNASVSNDPKLNYEKHSAGILISMMKPYQRFNLVEEIMESPKKNEVGNIIEGMILGGSLSVLQGKQLFKKAFAKGLIKQEKFIEYDENCKKVYPQGVQKLKEEVEKEMQKFKGMYSTNPLQRAFGGPMLGFAMGLHSILWLVANVMANKGELKNIIRNPYVYMAIGEYVLSEEIQEGGRKAGATQMGIGEGPVARFWYNLGENPPKNPEKARALFELNEATSNNLAFRTYLENGGARIIKDMHAKKLHSQKKSARIVTPSSYNATDELIRYEKNSKEKDYESRLRFLEEAKTNLPAQTELAVRNMPIIWDNLGVSNQKEFKDYLDRIKKFQGV